METEDSGINDESLDELDLGSSIRPRTQTMSSYAAMKIDLDEEEEVEGISFFLRVGMLCKLKYTEKYFWKFLFGHFFK